MPEAVQPPDKPVVVIDYDEGNKVKKEPTDKAREKARERQRKAGTLGPIKGNVAMTKQELLDFDGMECCAKSRLLVTVADRIGIVKPGDCCQRASLLDGIKAVIDAGLIPNG